MVKSSRSKRSPPRSRKSTIRSIEKSLEKPSDEVISGFEGVSFLFLLGAIAAVVAWMVYVAKFNLDFYRKVNNNYTVEQNIDGVAGELDPTISLRNTLTVNQYTICYQAVVAATLLYFAFKYHFSRK